MIERREKRRNKRKPKKKSVPGGDVAAKILFSSPTSHLGSFRKQRNVDQVEYANASWIFICGRRSFTWHFHFCSWNVAVLIRPMIGQEFYETTAIRRWFRTLAVRQWCKTTQRANLSAMNSTALVACHAWTTSLNRAPCWSPQEL